MDKLKTILRYLGYLLIALLIAMITIPFVFKDKIIALVRTEVNKHVNAEVKFKDADLSLFSSFPDVRLSIDSLVIIGVDTFDQVPLYSASSTYLDMSIPSLIENKPNINQITLKNSNINVVILKNGLANYDISKVKSAAPDASPSQFQLKLKKFEVENGNLHYVDKSMNLDFNLTEFDHQSKGDLSLDVYDLQTTTKSKAMTVTFDNMSYFKGIKTELLSNVHVNLPESKFAFKDNDITLNDLKLKGNGDIQLVGDDVIMNLDFISKRTSFKSLLSIIPNAYTADFANVKSSGNARAQGYIKGTYNGLKPSYPAFDVKIKVDNGMFQYPSLPQKVTNVFADIQIQAKRSDYKDMTINIPSFKSNIGDDFLSGKLLASNLTGNQYLDGFLNAKINLQNLKSAFPMPTVLKLAGNLECDLKFEGSMVDISAANLEKVKFDGGANLKNLQYQAENQPLITSELMSAKANPANLGFEATNLMFGTSDATLRGQIGNPLAIFSTNANTQINLSGSSRKIDLNQWMTATTTNNPTSETAPPSSVNMDAIKTSNIVLDYTIGELVYDKFNINNAKFNGNLSASAIDIKEMTATLGKSDLNINGAISNPYDYFFNQGILDGTINLRSNNFDANQFMTPSTSATTTESAVIPVPERVRVKVNTQANTVQYTNLVLNDFKGLIDIHDSEVKLVDVFTRALEGSFNVNGIYNTRDLKKSTLHRKIRSCED
jgi:hypothetical protein